MEITQKESKKQKMCSNSREYITILKYTAKDGNTNSSNFKDSWDKLCRCNCKDCVNISNKINDITSMI